jgi:hypothetical protein
MTSLAEGRALCDRMHLEKNKIPVPFTGGCACGAIRYNCSKEPVAMLNCHCRDCQRARGGPFTSVLVVPEAAVRFSGISTHSFTVLPENGSSSTRSFCPDCGSPLSAKNDAAPQFLALKAATLDDPSWFSPKLDIWTVDAQSWACLNPALPKFARYPPLAPTS